MMTILILLSVAVLAAGILIIMSPSGRDTHQITVKSDSNVVTVRSASSGSITISFDPTGLPAENPAVELMPGGDPAAENEVTLLEEFVDPKTSNTRKREIARTFTGLNCRFTVKEDPVTEAESSAAPHPISLFDEEGCDEGYMEPLFDDV